MLVENQSTGDVKTLSSSFVPHNNSRSLRNHTRRSRQYQQQEQHRFSPLGARLSALPSRLPVWRESHHLSSVYMHRFKERDRERQIHRRIARVTYTVYPSHMYRFIQREREIHRQMQSLCYIALYIYVYVCREREVGTQVEAAIFTYTLYSFLQCKYTTSQAASCFSRERR